MANNFSTDLEAGSSQYWSVADTASLDLSSFTISMWIKPETVASGTIQMLASKWNGTGNQRSWLFGLYNDGGTSKWYMDASSNGSNGGDNINNVAWVAGSWNHIAVSYANGTGAYVIYLNGSSTASGNFTQTSLFNSTADFNLGIYQPAGSASNFYDGLMNNVLVYNAVIGATAVGNLYTDGCNPSTTNLVSWWFSDNNNGNDLFGSNNLTGTNSPTFSSDVPFACAVGPTNLKSLDGNVKANIKSFSGNAIANIKSIAGNS